jgi:hypothetical protein
LYFPCPYIKTVLHNNIVFICHQSFINLVHK